MRRSSGSWEANAHHAGERAGALAFERTEVRFPISPGMQLVLTHTNRDPVKRVEPGRVRASNADLAHACYGVVVGHPEWERQLRLLDLPARRPVVRFNSGPGYQVGPNGTMEPMGDVMHMWVPWR